jgi:hypothetical protein
MIYRKYKKIIDDAFSIILKEISENRAKRNWNCGSGNFHRVTKEKKEGDEEKNGKR